MERKARQRRPPPRQQQRDDEAQPEKERTERRRRRLAPRRRHKRRVLTKELRRLTLIYITVQVERAVSIGEPELKSERNPYRRDNPHPQCEQQLALVQARLVRMPPDLYRLNYAMVMMMVEGFKDKNTRRLRDAIEKSREASLSRFLYALGMPGVGEVLARQMAEHFRSFDNFLLFANSPFEDRVEVLEKLTNIGSILQKDIAEYVKRPWFSKMLRDFADLGFSPVQAETSGPLAGQVFCITGTFSLSRLEIKRRIEKLGGSVVGSVTNKCRYLVVGENPGQDKLRELEKLAGKSDIKKLNEAALMRLLQGEAHDLPPLR